MGNNLKVSRLLHFDHKGNEMIALGLSDGKVVIKQAETLLSDDTIATIKSANVPDSEDSEELNLNRQTSNILDISLD